MRLKYTKLFPDAADPTFGTTGSAGMDLVARDELHLHPGDRAAVSTGLAFEVPFGYFGHVLPRSGLAVKHGIDTMAGVIDSDYRGEVCVLLVNLSNFPYRIRVGDRIAQFVLVKIAADVHLEHVEELSTTARGLNGFGSTGR